jgi:hypothetical protein
MKVHWPRLRRDARRGFFCWRRRALGVRGFGLATGRSAWRGSAHPPKNPFAGSWDVDENAIADACEGEPIWLIHPAAHRAGMAVDLFSERREIEVIV